jgi:hypothetical protein
MMRAKLLTLRCWARPVVAGLLVLLSAAPAAALAASDAVSLAPHRAVYEMSLGETRSGTSLGGINGRMVYEFTGSACEGYTLNMRLVTRLTDRSGQATVTDLRSSTWEQADGKQFRFNSSQYLDEKTSETTSGSVHRAEDGSVTLKLRKPVRVEREMPRDVVFPTQHSHTVLEAAAQGRKLVQAVVFDGSEKAEKIYETTAFIGQKNAPGEGDARDGRVANDEVLETLPSWPITISYFDQSSKGDTTPAYELSFRLYANGVSRDLVIDYGDFVLHGALESLEFLSVPPCK